MVYLSVELFQKLLPSKLHLVLFRANSCSHWVDLGIIFPTSPLSSLWRGDAQGNNSIHCLLYLDNDVVTDYSLCCSCCAQFSQSRASACLLLPTFTFLVSSHHNSFWSAICFQLTIQAKKIPTNPAALQQTFSVYWVALSSRPNPIADLQRVLGSSFINPQPYSRPSIYTGSSHSHWLNTLEGFWIHH